MSPETNILVCFALRAEAAAFQEFSSGKSSVSIFITGMGRKNAENALVAGLKICSPRLVLTCGFAGALNPDLKLGDVVFELFPGGSRANEAQTEIGNRQSEVGNQSEPPYVGCYERLVAAGAKPVEFFCATRVATTWAEKRELRRTTGADAVEMESEAIHNICHERGIPCATVRVISDTSSEDLPLDFNALANADFTLNYGKLVWALAKSPGKIPALVKLRRTCKFAAEQLAGVLRKVLTQPL